MCHYAVQAGNKVPLYRHSSCHHCHGWDPKPENGWLYDVQEIGKLPIGYLYNCPKCHHVTYTIGTHPLTNPCSYLFNCSTPEHNVMPVLCYVTCLNYVSFQNKVFLQHRLSCFILNDPALMDSDWRAINLRLAWNLWSVWLVTHTQKINWVNQIHFVILSFKLKDIKKK